jgi:hypothetical protein
VAWLKRETPYERRIRELEEEADRVRKSMQQLMRQVPPASGYASSPAASPRKTLGAARPAIRSTAAPSRFSDESSTAHEQPLTVEGQAPEESASVEKPAPAPAPSQRPDKMAHYLSSGSFGKGYSHARERRIQRNKAVMMFIFALLALYSLYMWLK